MKNMLIFSGFCFVLAGNLANAAEEDYGPFNFDGGKIACNDDSGPEIKKTQVYRTTNDRFFVENSINVGEISGWGKAHACSIFDVKKKNITVKTDVGTFNMPAIYEFSVYAHADCGSGIANNCCGKTASVECSVSAKTQKYTNQ